MGSATSLSKESSSSRFNAIFTTDSLRRGCADLKANAQARAAFVDFIKDGPWYDALDILVPNIVTARKVEGSVWRRFGYNEVCRSGECSVAPSVSVSRSNSPDISGKNSGSLRTTTFANSARRRPCMFLVDKELRAVLISALYPIFLSSIGNARTANLAPSETAPGQMSPEVQHKFHKRLHEVLHHATAIFDQAELCDYFAAPGSNFVSELKVAFGGMGIKMMLAEVNKDRKESCIIYTNVRPEDKNRTLLAESETGLLGQDLHVLFGNICSPGGAEAIQRAVLNGKLHKQTFLLADGSVKLLAICPIADVDGKAKYAVSLESEAFAEGEEPFEEIEDMLVLLPLLVRA